LYQEQFKVLIEAINELRDAIAEMNKYRFADQYLDNDDLTAILKISKRTAQEWRDKKILPFVQIGKKIYYRLSDLEAMFDNEFKKVRPGRVRQGLKRKRPEAKKGNNGWIIKV
jgi:hypothetical protein